MLVPSGTVGNDLFAFGDLVDVRVDIVARDVDRSRDVTLRVLVGCMRIDEDRGACVKIFLRVRERDPRRGVFGVTVTVDVGSRSRSARNSHRRSRGVSASRGKTNRGDQ